MVNKFLTSKVVCLQDRLDKYRDFLLDEADRTFELTLNAFNDVAKQIVAESEDILGTKVTLPDIDIIHNRPNVDFSQDVWFNVEFKTHRGYSKWLYEVSARVLCNLENFSAVLFKCFRDYLTDLSRILVADYNAQVLTNVVSSIVKTPKIEFYIGDGITNLRENSIALGIAQDKLLNISSILSGIGNLTSSIRETFENLPCVIVCKKRRTEFAFKMGIYTMKSIRRLIKNEYHRSVYKAHDDIGVLEKDNMISLFDCVTTNPRYVNRVVADMKSIYGSALIKVLDNTKPMSGEYIKCHSKAELDETTSRLGKQALEYKIIDTGNDTYKVVTETLIVYARIFGPINLDTYTTSKQSDSDFELLSY